MLDDPLRMVDERQCVAFHLVRAARLRSTSTAGTRRRNSASAGLAPSATAAPLSVAASGTMSSKVGSSMPGNQYW